jgi:hypothetical protein
MQSGDGRCVLGRLGASAPSGRRGGAERSELIRRAIDTRTMPPAGTELDDADRHALASWLLNGPAAPQK